MNLLNYQTFYLVGIKGVAMTSLAQCLVDAGKKVSGADVEEKFVTQEILDTLGLPIDIGFAGELPSNTECVIYTSAHQAQLNPLVQLAVKKNLPVFSQAEAVADLFNQKKGIAVCGVGGKSTTSAMITWILEKAGEDPSFSVGVGNIPGLERTGQWSSESEYFVAEADEYVIDPSAPSRGQPITPRFSFLKPFITVCTNLKFDHPDVYKSFDETKETYLKFFSQIVAGGKLMVNGDDAELSGLELEAISYGFAESANFHITEYASVNGVTRASFIHDGSQSSQTYQLEILLPGKFNVMNALAAVVAAFLAGVPIEKSCEVLKSFHSTLRRAQFIGDKNGVKFYDDYAHHPSEVQQLIHAFKEWYPTSKLVVAFQSHTYSRTKQLFNEFVDAFAEADEVVMIDIFASARENFDPSVSSDLLCSEISKKFPKIPAQNFKNLEKLAAYCRENLKTGDVCITVGAGDIYRLHDLLQSEQ